MTDTRKTPIGTPVVLAPGKVVLVGEYAALADGSTVEAAFGCYAKAQFIPQMDSVMTLVSEIIEQVRAELAEVAPALPPGSVLLTNADFRGVGPMAAGLGGSAALAVAAVGAVLESLGLALEARKPLVFRIADAARRGTQGYSGAGSDTAAATYGGLIRTGPSQAGQRQLVPLAPPSGLRLVVFAAGPSLPPAQVVQALERFAREDSVSFLEAVAKLRTFAQLFLDEATAGQATAAIAAAGRYGEVFQGLCVAAQAPIMTPAFQQAAELAREYGGMAKPTGAGGGEIGVALFATPEASQRFRQACREPLLALDGDLDTAGVRCEFPDNAVVVDLDERDSAEVLAEEPDEFSLPTVKTGPPVAAELADTVTARTPAADPSPAPEPTTADAPARPRRRWLVPVLLGLTLAVLASFVLGRWLPSQAPSPRARPEPPRPQPAVALPPVEAVQPSPAEPPAAIAPGPSAAVTPEPSGDPGRSAATPTAKKRKHRSRASARIHRAGGLSPDDF